MTVQSVTLRLPETVMRRARQTANVLQRPLEELLTGLVTAALPDVEDAPLEVQAELARMTWFSDQELWSIARSTMPVKQQEQLRSLADLQTIRALTPAEQEALDNLRREYGRVTLRKARAYALLSLRGGAPLLTGV
ncbi:MAG: hypothetical protein ISS50_09290 [Anaerolineae bacterium]|nr:hypothetical protein [Anaerolineae bacterium]